MKVQSHVVMVVVIRDDPGAILMGENSSSKDIIIFGFDSVLGDSFKKSNPIQFNALYFGYPNYKL